MFSKIWTAFLLMGVVASAVAWVAALCHEKGIRPFAGAVRFVRELPWGGRLALLPLFVALVAYGSTKNSSELRVGSLELGANQYWPCRGGESVEGCESISSRVERVDGVDNVANVEVLPVTNANTQLGNGEWGTGNVSHRIDKIDRIGENAVVCEDWLKFGGFEDWIYLGPGGWSFRHGSNFVERLAVFSSGKIRLLKQDGGDAWIALSAVPVSIVPEANWHRLKTADSLFWHAETPSNTLLLTWCNALLNRDTNSPVNIQAELFPSGGMRITHDLSGELVTEHVPAPELPCADTLDEVLARIEGGNSNAYFFADVAVAKGPAVVKVKSGRETTLGDYSFVAHPGVTNRLPFLIGPEYEVKSEAAYSHFSVTNIEVAVSNLTDRLAAVQWPVKIDFGEGYDFGGGKLFEVAVDPPFLNGIMEFDGNANGNMRMLPRSGGGCGCVVSVTNGAVTVTGVCSNDTCVHEGSYVYEGYREHIELECEMDSGEDPEPEPDDPSSPEEENEPGASVWFEEKAVIFEDEYENAPGETVPRRSTRTTLRCTAYGGERGGNLTVDLSGMDALRLVSGTPPSGRTLAPGEYVEFEAGYEAEKASSQENGTVAKVSFTENETNITFDAEDKMTVVEVKKMAVATVPPFRQRKDIGVGERVDISISPRNIAVAAVAEIGKVSKDGLNGYVYLAPHNACHDKFSLSVRDVDFEISFEVIQPSGFAVKSIVGVNNGVPNKAGMYSAFINYVPLPTNVSFYALQFMEVGTKATDAMGYFAKPEYLSLLDHSIWGADDWFSMESYSDYFVDEIGIPGELAEPWNGGGSFTWPIPVIWRFYEETGVSNLLCNINQRFELDANGTSRVRKMGCTVERGTNQYFRAVIGL